MTDNMGRRDFLELLAGGLVLGAGALQPSRAQSATETTATAATASSSGGRKLRLGLVGCGQRGTWIAKLFLEHGGYEFAAVADYFPDRAAGTGAQLGVDASRCFSGLSGYRKVFESGVEAVVLEALPYCFPDHAAAAVEAGLHVYMAKPVAVDVPGTLRIGQAGEVATKAGRVFLVDYQMPTDPGNIEVARRVRDGALGPLQAVWSCGYRDDNGFSDPPDSTPESRLLNITWMNYDALGGGYLGNYDVHVIDALIWTLGRRPVAAYGQGRQARPSPHGDTHDTYSIVYTFDDGLPWYHNAATGRGHDWIKEPTLDGSLQGREASARVSYYNKAYIRGGPHHMGAVPVADLYPAGAKRNIARFHELVLAGNCENETVSRAVDGNLTAILGREAARRGALLTMEQLVTANHPLLADLTGMTT